MAEVGAVKQEVIKISKDEARKALKRTKNRKAVGPDDKPVEVLKCLGQRAVEFLMKLFYLILDSGNMPEEWRDSELVPMFWYKGDSRSFLPTSE